MKPLAMTEDNFNAIVRAADPSATDIKTETRRLFTIPKLTQQEVNEFKSVYQDGGGNWVACTDDSPNHAAWVKKAYPNGEGIKSRLQIGDRAYLKEPTQVLCTNPEDSTNIESCNVAYFWGDKLTDWEGISDRRWIDLAEGDSEKLCNRKTGIYSKQGAMFMLKSFARHSVEILDVRVEKLLDITDEGAIAEGILKPRVIEKNGVTALNFYDYMTGNYTRTNDAKGSYFSEIAYIHKKSGGWDLVKSNPWLWVYKFRYITGDDNA